MSDFHLKRGDTRPVLEVELKNPDGSPHDLTAATSVTLHVRLGTATLSRAMTIDPVPSSGLVRYTWLAGDWTALISGRHQMEYEVVGPGGARLTFPNSGYDILVVTEDLGEA